MDALIRHQSAAIRDVIRDLDIEKPRALPPEKNVTKLLKSMHADNPDTVEAFVRCMTSGSLRARKAVAQRFSILASVPYDAVGIGTVFVNAVYAEWNSLNVIEEAGYGNAVDLGRDDPTYFADPPLPDDAYWRGFTALRIIEDTCEATGTPIPRLHDPAAFCEWAGAQENIAAVIHNAIGTKVLDDLFAPALP